MPLTPNRTRGASKKRAAPQPSHVKPIAAPTPEPIAVIPEEKPARSLPIPRSSEELNLAHAKKLDTNLRAGGRYPYTPNPSFRKNLTNPSFLEDNRAKFLAQ